MDLLFSLVAGFLGTAILSIVGTYLLVAWSRARKTVFYEVRTTVTRSPTACLRVSVPSSLLTQGHQWPVASDGERAEFDAAHIFEVRLRSSGNAVLTDPIIAIELEDGVIVGIDTDPESRVELPVQKERDARNMSICRVLPAYLNPGDRMLLKVTSVNTSGPGCRVSVFGAGVKCRDVGSLRRRVRRACSISGLAWLAVVVVAGILARFLELSTAEQFGWVWVVGLALGIVPTVVVNDVLLSMVNAYLGVGRTSISVDPELAAAIDHLVEDWPGVSRRRMFGGLCYTVYGRMFVALLDNLVVFKVPDVQREACLAEQGVCPANLHGTAFGKWLEWPWEGVGGVEPVARWVRASYELDAPSQGGSPAKGKRNRPRRRRLS